MLLLSSALAATWTVGTSASANFASIPAAVGAASNEDVILVEPGTWYGAIDFAGKSLELRARDGASVTTIDGTGSGHALYLYMGEVATIDGFTVVNTGGSGLYAEGGTTLTLKNSVFSGTGNESAYGGGLSVGTAYLTVEDTVFTGGTALYGGAVYQGAGSSTFTRCTFTNGTGSAGGGIYNGGASMQFDASSIDHNTASSSVAGLVIAGGGVVRLTDTAVEDNLAAASHGAGIYLADGSTLVITGGTIARNQTTTWETAGTYGGAIYATGSDVSITGTTFDTNYAYYGGAIFQSGGSLTVDGAVFTGNYAYYGGGIFDQYAAVTLTNPTFDSNTSLYNGAGFYSNSGSTWTLTGGTFTENLATYGSGGGGLFYAGTLSVTDTVFRENLAYYSGGGLYLTQTYNTITLTNPTFEQNEASYSSGGGFYADYSSSVTLTGGTFKQNQGAAGGGAYLYYGSSLEATGTTWSANSTNYYAGGAISAYGAGLPTRVSLTACSLTDNTSVNEGGAIHARSLTAVTLNDNSFLRNGTGNESYGGALFIQSTATTRAASNLFAQNVARYGGAAYIDSATTAGAWTNNVFAENTAANGGGVCLTNSLGQVWNNNTFVGNSGTEAGGVLCLYGTAIDFRNNLVAWTGEGAAVHEWAAEGSLATFGYNAWYENLAGNHGGDAGDVASAPGSVTGDPKLVAYTLDGTPDNDLLVPLRDSPLVDAGDPAILDLDGTTSDIGASGGPGADATDADGDGHPASVDCDDNDAAANPDAFERWYDGANGDCRGVSDFDQDGDSFDAEEHGGTDCDDTDPFLTDPCTAAEDDTGKRDRDFDGGPATGGCGCATGSNVAGLGSVLLGLALAARRRR